MNTTDIIVALIAALLGTGTGGAVVAWRKDSRQAPIDNEAARKAKLEVAQMIEQMATAAVERARTELERQEYRHREELAELRSDLEEKIEEERDRLGRRMESERRKLRQRIANLEHVITAAGLTVPPWEDQPAYGTQ